MKVTQITVSYSRTESLQDYCNVKPGITLTADVHEGENLDVVKAELFSFAKATIHAQVDTAREQADLSPKFYKGDLHRVYINHSRQCMVIVGKSADLPQRTANWKYDDLWKPLTGWVRPSRAYDLALPQNTGNYPIYDYTDGDFSQLPPVPDAGPVPGWISKDLENLLIRMDIDRNLWEELGELEHVNRDYLHHLYYFDAERLSASNLVDLIRHNKPWPPVREDKADRDTPEGD